MRKIPSSAIGRIAAWSRLGKKMDEWIKLDNQSLLMEVRKLFPIVVDGTRDEFLKFLVMHHAEKIINS